MIRFNYRGFHGCPSLCGLHVELLPDGRTLVICTELSDNSGTSVTNFAEELATLVCGRFGVAPDRLVWIEHYPASPVHGPEPDWDLVEFTWDGARFQDPNWRPMRPQDWKQLGIAAPDA